MISDEDLEQYRQGTITLDQMREKMAILGRRREVDSRLPLHMRLAIQRRLRKGGLPDDQRAALEMALYDPDAIELLSEHAQDEGLNPPDQPKDWAGFFDALAAFLERIIPLLLQLFGMMGGVVPVIARGKTG